MSQEQGSPADQPKQESQAVKTKFPGEVLQPIPEFVEKALAAKPELRVVVNEMLVCLLPNGKLFVHSYLNNCEDLTLTGAQKDEFLQQNRLNHQLRSLADEETEARRKEYRDEAEAAILRRLLSQTLELEENLVTANT
jgi:hypothetical protein